MRISFFFMNYEKALERLKTQSLFYLCNIADYESEELQNLLAGFDHVFSHSLKDTILKQFKTVLLEQISIGDPRIQTALSGIDNLLTYEFKLRDYSAIEPRQLPDKFQLTVEEASCLPVPNPHDAVDREELKAMYPRAWERAYLIIERPKTFSRLKDKVLEIRARGQPVGTKAELALEDYFMLKTGYFS